MCVCVCVCVSLYNLRKTVQGLDLFSHNPRLIGISVEFSMTTAIGYIINFRLKYTKNHMQSENISL